MCEEIQEEARELIKQYAEAMRNEDVGWQEEIENKILVFVEELAYPDRLED